MEETQNNRSKSFQLTTPSKDHTWSAQGESHTGQEDTVTVTHPAGGRPGRTEDNGDSMSSGSASRVKTRTDGIAVGLGLSRENSPSRAGTGTVSPAKERSTPRTVTRSRAHSESEDMAGSGKHTTDLNVTAAKNRLSSFVKKVRMGKRIEKAFTSRDKTSSASHHDLDDDPNKTPEPHICTGHFSTDFTELCRRNSMVAIPPVVLRPRRPPSPSSQPPPEEKTRPGKKDDKKNQPPPEPTPEPEVDENGDPIEPPPKTYTTKEKFEYLKPCVQVEMDNPDKLDTVTEVYIRGWKIDEPMMTIFKQCWPKMDKLHTVNLWRAGLHDDTLELLASIIPECANLRNLILDNNPVPGEGYHQLLKEDSPVQNLSLRYNAMTDKGAELLGQALGTTTQQNQKLVSLNLNGNKITDAGAEHLAKGLRMNRTLLSLGLANNQIGDGGAKKLAETLSRFILTHEEVVERRKLLSDRDRQKSPPPGSRRADSRDRPGSVRSTHALQSKGKSAKPKKETKGKDDDKADKTKGKKEQEKTKKDSRGSRGTSAAISGRGSGASVVADAGKTGKKTKGGGKKSQPADHEPPETPELINPLLEKPEHIEGALMMSGNRILISLNLSNNQIGQDGIQALQLAIGYQSSLSQPGHTGLMRLCVQRNCVEKDNEHLQKLSALMATKDPFYKPPAASPDQDSQAS